MLSDVQEVVREKIVAFNQLNLALPESARVVQCHGVFDLLHIGHIKHFKRAKSYGDFLVVTITPDRYVNKGPDRPHFAERLRAEAIAALDCVDFVVINEWPTAIEAIALIKPSVYVKGSEYRDASNDLTGKISDEVDAVKSVGGEVAFTDDVTFSSSSLLNQFFSPYPVETVDYLSGLKERYSQAKMLSYLENAQSLKVLVVGEAIIDTYHFSTAIGKAGKEPTLVAKQEETKRYLGGILALANHLSDFVADVTCFTYLGEAKEHESLISTGLKENVTLLPLYKKDAPTIEKRRYVDAYLKQKLFEVYEINDDFMSAVQQQEAIQMLKEEIDKHDLIIVADYGHGLLDDSLIGYITSQNKFLAVNTQANAGNNGFNCISKYHRADFIAIATRELQLNYRQRHLSVQEQMTRLMREHEYQQVLITAGTNGSYMGKSNASDITKVPAFATGVKDRVGAGDAVLAITSLYAYQDAPSEITAFVGNVVGAEAVNIMGNERSIEKVPLMKHISHILK